MDKEEFRRRLDLFPIVRSRDYIHTRIWITSIVGRFQINLKIMSDLDPSAQSTSRSPQDEVIEWQDAWNDEDMKQEGAPSIDLNDAFWQKLKIAAEKKVGAAEAERFCSALQRVHQKLVYGELDSDAAHSFINS